MYRQGVSLLLVLLLVSCCSALKCYQCTACDDWYSSVTEVECQGGENSCLKGVVGGHIQKGCVPSQVCNLADVAKGFFHYIASRTDQDNSRLVYCCDTDYCNGSSGLEMSLLLLAMCTLLVHSIF